MSAYIGLLKFDDRSALSGDQELVVGKTARALADMEAPFARFLSILWSTDGDYDMVLTLEAKTEAVAAKVFSGLGAQAGASVAVMPAFVKWEQSLLAQGKPI